MMDRPMGLSVRAKFALSYTALLIIAGALLLGVVWVFLLRYVPAKAMYVSDPGGESSVPGVFVPGRDDLWRAFAPKAAIVMAALLVVGLVGGWLLAGRMLAPLNRITTGTRLVAKGTLSYRIALPGRRDEFRELADAFDAMVARIEAQVVAQRRFAANASHELRTPLAITQSMLDVARQGPGCNTAQLLERLQAVNSRAITLVEALLTLSRADQRSFTQDVVDLSLLGEEAVELLLPLAERNGVTIRVSGGVSRVTGSRALLSQMTVNLVHNAIVHNLPDHGLIELSTQADPQSGVLIIENTGDEIDPGLAARLTEPFQRGDERIRRDHAGVGLGLAIVASIVQAHDGGLAVTARVGGGLRVVVRLPVVPPAPPSTTEPVRAG
jgi:two-component system sensor histidine kinase VanS